MTRRFIRHHGGSQAAHADAATALREALAADGEVVGHDEAMGAEPPVAFRLRTHGVAVLILSHDGRHLGTFADPMRAVVHAFGVLDAVAAQPQPTRSQRSTRRPTKEARPR